MEIKNVLVQFIEEEYEFTEMRLKKITDEEVEALYKSEENLMDAYYPKFPNSVIHDPYAEIQIMKVKTETFLVMCDPYTGNDTWYHITFTRINKDIS